MGPEENGQRGLRPPPQPRAEVPALPPPRVQVGPGSLARAQVRVRPAPEGPDGRKHPIRFVITLSAEVRKVST